MNPVSPLPELETVMVHPEDPPKPNSRIHTFKMFTEIHRNLLDVVHMQEKLFSQIYHISVCGFPLGYAFFVCACQKVYVRLVYQQQKHKQMCHKYSPSVVLCIHYMLTRGSGVETLNVSIFT